MFARFPRARCRSATCSGPRSELSHGHDSLREGRPRDGAGIYVLRTHNDLRLELIVQPDQSQLERVAESASVALGKTVAEICGAGAGDTGGSEIDVPEFGTCGPVLRQHMLDTYACGPADFGLVLREGSDIPGNGYARANQL